MEKRASTAVVRTATAALALAPLALLYQAGWFTIGELSTDRLQAWVHQPLTTGFITLLAYTSAWLLWVLLMTAVAGHTYRYLAARLRWHLTLHLPGPLQHSRRRCSVPPPSPPPPFPPPRTATPQQIPIPLR